MPSSGGGDRRLKRFRVPPPAGILEASLPALGCAREEGKKMWMREHGGLCGTVPAVADREMRRRGGGGQGGLIAEAGCGILDTVD